MTNHRYLVVWVGPTGGLRGLVVVIYLRRQNCFSLEMTVQYEQGVGGDGSVDEGTSH